MKEIQCGRNKLDWYTRVEHWSIYVYILCVVL